MPQLQVVSDKDLRDGPYHHRYLVPQAAKANVETASLTSATLRAVSAGVNTPFDPMGSRNVKVRVFLGADTAQSIADKTVTLTCVGVPRKTALEVAQPKGRTLFVATFTAGTSLVQNVNPITGATAATTDYREADTIDVSEPYTGYRVLDGTEDGSGGNDSEAVLEFDPMGMTVYCYITDWHADFDDLTTPEIHVSLER